jgi:hypothetical protein
VLVQANIGKIVAYLWAICGVVGSEVTFFNELIEFGRRNPDHAGVPQILAVFDSMPSATGLTLGYYQAIFTSPWAPHADLVLIS